MGDVIEQPFGAVLIAGDDWSWTVSLLDYPPSSFTLKYFLRGPNAPADSIDLVATNAPDGTDFLVTAAAADTSPLGAGVYAWQMCIYDAAGKRTEIGRGEVTLLVDISVETPPIDGRSFVKRALDQVQALILETTARIEAEYSVAGRQVMLKKLSELENYEGRLVARYRRELVESGQLKPQTNQVQVAFGDPTNPLIQRLWKNFPGNSA